MATETALQIAKSAAEVAAIGVGAEEWLLKKKLGSLPTPEVAAQWHTIWSDISVANEYPREVII